jgi:hypothetical protein
MNMLAASRFCSGVSSTCSMVDAGQLRATHL